MDSNKHELNIDSLESISGGVNRIVQFRPVSKEQARDYQHHGSTVVSISEKGDYRLNNGQILKFDKSGLYLLY